MLLLFFSFSCLLTSFLSHHLDQYINTYLLVQTFTFTSSTSFILQSTSIKVETFLLNTNAVHLLSRNHLIFIFAFNKTAARHAARSEIRKTVHIFFYYCCYQLIFSRNIQFYWLVRWQSFFLPFSIHQIQYEFVCIWLLFCNFRNLNFLLHNFRFDLIFKPVLTSKIEDELAIFTAIFMLHISFFTWRNVQLTLYGTISLRYNQFLL